MDFELQQFIARALVPMCSKPSRKREKGGGRVAVKLVKLKLVRKLQFWKAKEQGHFPS